MNEKNGWLHDGIKLFERSPRATKHGQWGAHIYTKELSEMFGATRGEPFIGEDGRQYNTAFYEDEEVGDQASKYVADKIWEKSEGDTLKFVSRYAGKPIDDPSVINYASVLNKNKSAQNYAGAVGRVKNRENLLKKKDELIAENPDKESKIMSMIEKGLHSADGIRDEITKSIPKENFDYESFKQDVLTSLDISDDEIEGAKNAFIRGYGNLKTMTNVLGLQLGINPEERVRQIASEQAKNESLPASDTFNRAMNPSNDFSTTLKEIGSDPISVTTQLATESLVQFLPPAIIVGLPIGVATAIVGAPAWITVATAGGIASLGMEWSSEILNSFSQQGVNVKDPDSLADAFSNEEVNAKAKQEALEKGVPVAVFDTISGGVAGRWVRMARNMGLTKNLTAVGKEILVQAGLGGTGEAVGQAVALDPEEGEQFNIPAIVAESIVEIGTGSVSGAVTLTFDNGNSIEVPENDPLVQDLITAKTNQLQEPTNDQEADYKRRIDALKNYKGKVSVGFSEGNIEQVFTEQEIIGHDYNPSQFEDSLIKEGDEGYVNDGVNRYRLPVRANNSEFGDGSRRVLLSKEAESSDFLEDTAEAVYDRMDDVNPTLKRDIDRWTAGVEQEARLNNESLPYTGAELFSKSLLRSLGYEVSESLPNYTVLPDSIVESFKQELVLDDGTNLIDGLEGEALTDLDSSQAIDIESLVFADVDLMSDKQVTEAIVKTGFVENEKSLSTLTAPERREALKRIQRVAPVEIPTENKQMEMFSLGKKAEGGVFVIGGDAVGRNARGERSIEGIRYPEKYDGWQLSEGGATAVENQAKAGNDVIIVYQYPSQSATESNPRFKEVFEIEKKKNAKRSKKNKKTLIELRKEVEKMVSEPDVNLNRGQVLYVAQFDKVLRGEERTQKHSTYPAQIVFKNVKELSKPFSIEALTDSIDPAISRNAQTFISSRDLRARSSNLYLAPNESPIVKELRAFSEGKPSQFDARIDSDQVFSTYRRKGETTVEGVFGSINSERELLYMGTMSDIAKELKLKGRPAQAGAVTSDFGKENSMVFTVENPDQNALDLYIAYAGLLGNQFSVMHFKPDPNGKDSVYRNDDTFKKIDEVTQLSKMYFDKGVDHTVEIRGNKAQFILIDTNNENFVNFQEKGVIDDNTRTTKGSLEFRESQDSKLYDTSTSEKKRRKLARDYWQSEIQRLQELGYTSEAGQQAYSNLKPKLEKGEGFSLGRSEQKEYASYYNQKITRKQIKTAKSAEKLTLSTQKRDLVRTLSSQLNRIDPKITEALRRFQKNHADILYKYVEASTPFAKTLKRLSKSAKSRKNKANYVALKLALFNGDVDTVTSILKTKKRIKEYNTFKQAHENLHEQAMSVGIDMGHIENHFPREIINYDVFLQEVYGITSSGKRSILSEAIDDAQTKAGRVLTEEEIVQVANMVMRQSKGLYNSTKTDWAKTRKIEKITLEQLKFYDEPHNTLARYGSGMAKMIASAQYLGGRPNRYSVRKLPKILGEGVGIYDNKVGAFENRSDNSNEILSFQKRNDPNVSKALEVLRKENQRATGMPFMSLQDQIGGMVVKLQADIGFNRGQEARLTRLLTAYFKQDSMNSVFTKMRNIGYISTMGSVFSAVTQLGDLGVAVYRSGRGKFLGYLRPSTYTRVIAEMFKSITKLNKYNLKKLGVDDTILQELSDNKTSLQNAMNWVFKLSGLKLMDRVGKETFVNTAMKRYEKGSKQILKGKNNRLTRDLKARLKRKFNDNEVQQLTSDLASGKTTELTELLAYSELLDVQPVGRSELPVGYLDYPNGRILYMLKTFMLKRFDVFVNETQILKEQGKHASAIMNLVMLGTVLALGEAGADLIKDRMAGRKTPIPEYVWGNLLKLIGVSRYHYYNFLNSKPSQAILKMIIPPYDYIDDPWMDLKFLVGRMEKYKNTSTPAKYALRDFQKRGARWIKHIPVIGKHLYWLDDKSDLSKSISNYAPLMSPSAGNISMDKRLKKERNK